MPAILLFFTFPLLAQFQELATNGDGTVLYFSSPNRLRGTVQNDTEKLFVWQAGEFRLAAMRERGEPMGWYTSNFYDFRGTQISGDGRILKTVATRLCGGGSGCLAVETRNTEVAGRGFPGWANMSRNGRWLVVYGANYFATPPAVQRPVRLIQLETGAEAVFPFTNLFTAGAGRAAVAADGTAIFADSQRQLQLLRAGRFETLSNAAPSGIPVIDDAARRIVYEGFRTAADSDIREIDLLTGRERVLAPGRAPCLSADGNRVLFLDGDSVHLFDIPTNEDRLLARNVREAVLSGNGRFVFAATTEGRLLRIAAEGEIEELAPRTPLLSSATPNASYAAGSMLSLTGSGFALTLAFAQSVPLPRRLAGLELWIDGRAVPLLSVSPAEIRFQVPWETGRGEVSFELRTGNSPFEPPFSALRIVDDAPAGIGAGVALAAHQDYRGLVTAQDPARPGEWVHVYLTGLGPVSPQPATGEPAGAAPTTQRVTCQNYTGDNELLAVAYAGLAPGTVGFYQVTLRVPSGSYLNFGCWVSDGRRSFLTLPIAP